MKKWLIYIISSLILVSLLALPVMADNAEVIVNDDSFDPTTFSDVPWAVHAHTGFDNAFLSSRAHDSTDGTHIQIDDDTAYFYGYEYNPYSDYLYYEETDPTEKTFSFGMDFSVYTRYTGSPPDPDDPVPHTWHSLASLGFLINCVENSDNTISGYYFALEDDTASSTEDKIVVRLLDHVDFNALSSNSTAILSTPVIFQTALVGANHTYEVKSSNTAFSVTQDGNPLFSLDSSTAGTTEIPGNDYTGGNDFGFYAGYSSHGCTQLSFAVFSDVQLTTKSVTPESDLNVRFVDYRTKTSQSPVEIESAQNKTGYIGQKYTIKPPSTLNGYYYVNADSQLSGIYQEETAETSLYYVKPTLTIRYIDQDGNLLEPETQVDNVSLTSYSYNAKDFSGYKLNGDSSKSVTLSADAPDGVIEFIYQKASQTTTSSQKTVAASPPTGDSDCLILVLSVLLASISLFVFGMKKRVNNK